ncbi:MAG: hypothetical protein QTN59_20740 [Candidatus Electrothrix communis]|nr:MAG: hypothetical protein QTN59_20740 [Candidatus Electrothrix communis]
MSEALLKDIASKVVEQDLLANWRFYAIFLPSIFLSSALGAYVANRYKKKAEIDAVDADLKKILRQLEKTTEVTEQVRSKVDYADWVEREWKTIRRVKLEELVQSAISVRPWFDQQCSACRQCSLKRESENCPANHTAMIAALYFPEIQRESEQLVKTAYTAICWMHSKLNEILNAVPLQGSEAEIQVKRGELWQQHGTVEEWSKHWQALLDALKALEVKAAQVMCDVLK